MMSSEEFHTDCVIQHTKYQMYTRFGLPKLYRYVQQGKWHKIPRRCQTHPKEAKFINKYPPHDTCLHALLRCDTSALEAKINLEQAKCIYHAKVAATQALLQANLTIVSISDSRGRTPLHLAASYNASSTKEIVELLAKVCPTATSIQDQEGKTPVDYLAELTDTNTISGDSLSVKKKILGKQQDVP